MTNPPEQTPTPAEIEAAKYTKGDDYPRTDEKLAVYGIYVRRADGSVHGNGVEVYTSAEDRDELIHLHAQVAALTARAEKAEAFIDRCIKQGAGDDGTQARRYLARAEAAEAKVATMQAHHEAGVKQVMAMNETSVALAARVATLEALVTDALMVLDGVADGDFAPDGASVINACIKLKAALTPRDGGGDVQS